MALKTIPGLPDETYNVRWVARLMQRSRPGENWCVELDGFHNADGYGNAHHRKWGCFPHRIIMILLYGPIPDGMMVCHRCGNHGCVNPDHLYIGTMQQNARDTVAMGRHRESQKTHCPKGHPLSGDNIRMAGPRKTKRQCITCQRERAQTPEEQARGRERQRRRRAEKRAARLASRAAEAQA